MKFDAAGRYLEGEADVDPVAAPATVKADHILNPKSGVMDDPAALHLVLAGTGSETVTLDLYMLVEDLGFPSSVSAYINTNTRWVRFAQGIVVTNGIPTILTENIPSGGVIYARRTADTITASQERALLAGWSKVKKKNSYLTKALTFDNDTGALNIFTVTGDVIVRVVAVCKTSVASVGAGNVELGIAGATGELLPTTLGTDLDAGDIWHDATPDAKIELESVRRDYIISDGNDIILTLSAQIDSGVINFYCEWEPLSIDGNVSVA
jgi:hypothetical protein